VLHAVGHIAEYGICTFYLSNPANNVQLFAFASECTQAVEVVECNRKPNDVTAINFTWLVHCMQAKDFACTLDVIYSAGFTSFHPYYWNLNSSELSKCFALREILNDDHIDLKSKLEWLLGNYERLATNQITCDAKTSDSKTSDAKTSDAKTSDAKTSDAKTSDAKTSDGETSDGETSDGETSDGETSDGESPETYRQLEANFAQLTSEFKQYTRDSSMQLQQTCDEHERTIQQYRDANAQLQNELLQVRDETACETGQLIAQHEIATHALHAEHESSTRRADDDYQSNMQKLQGEFRTCENESSNRLNELETMNHDLAQKLQEITLTYDQNQRTLLETKRMLNEQQAAQLRSRLQEEKDGKLQSTLQDETDAHAATKRALAIVQTKLDEVQENHTRYIHGQVDQDEQNNTLIDDTLKMTLPAHARELITTRKACMKAQHDHDATRAELRTTQMELQDARDAHAETSHALQAHARDLINMRKACMQSQHDHDAVRSELHVTQTELHDVRDAHAETSHALHAHTRDLIAMRQACKQAQHDNELARLELSTSQTELRDVRDRHAEVIRTLQNDLNGKRNASLQVERDAHAESLQAEIDAHAESLQVEIDAHAETSNALREHVQELNTIRQACIHAQRQHDSARSELTSIRAELRDAQEHHTEVIRTLQSDLCRKHDASLKVERDVHAETSSILQEHVRSLVTARQACIQTQQQHDSARSELASVQAELRDAREHHTEIIRTLQTDLYGKFEASIKVERDAHAVTSSMLQEQARALITVRQSCMQTQQQYDSALSELSSVQAELVDAREHHAEIIRTLQTDLYGKLEASLQVERDAHADTSSIIQAQARELATSRQASRKDCMPKPNDANRSGLRSGLASTRVEKAAAPTKVEKAAAPTKVDNRSVVSTISSIVGRVLSRPELSTLASLISLGDLVDMLSTAGPFTFFAPTNDAFAALTHSTRVFLTSPVNTKELKYVLKNHAVKGTIMSRDLTCPTRASTSLKTLNCHDIMVTTRASDIFVTNAKVLSSDLICTNGILHIIDRVITVNAKTTVHVPNDRANDRGKENVTFCEMWEHPHLSIKNRLMPADFGALRAFIDRAIAVVSDSISVVGDSISVVGDSMSVLSDSMTTVGDSMTTVIDSANITHLVVLLSLYIMLRG
jgi:uncharacterized surface protein with fasciclin (FAS1) repeats